MKKVRGYFTLVQASMFFNFCLVATTSPAHELMHVAEGSAGEAGQNATPEYVVPPLNELNQRFADAVAMERQHKAQASMAAFAALLQRHPKSPEIANNLAVLYAREGNYAKARSLLLLARKSRPDYAVAGRNLDQVETALAAVTYNQALNDPEHHRPKNLINSLELALSIGPAESQPEVRSVAELAKSSHADRIHHRPFRSSPAPVAAALPHVKSPDDWLNEGYTALNRKDKPAALYAFDQATRLSPDDVEAWKNLGYLNLDLQHKAQALQNFQKASVIAPKDAEVWKNIGYLDIDRDDKPSALHAFTEAKKYKPDDVEVLTNLGYLQTSQGNKREALSDFLAAQKLKPDNNEVNMAIAYLQSALGQPKAAEQQFDAVQRSTHDAATREQACSGAHDAALASTRLLSSPNFGDIYFAPSYEDTRYTDGLIPFKARLGRHFGENDRGSVYGFLSAQDDTGSSSGLQPSILNDNAVVAGGGVDYRPIEEWPVTVYAEAGYGYDLTYRNRSRGRYSAEVGITGYQAWGLPGFDCDHRTNWLWKPYIDLYGDVQYATRQEDDVLLQLRPRFGVTAVRSSLGSARLYLKLNLLADSKRLYYNNLFEFGPGAAWQTNTTIPLIFRVEYVWGRYTVNAQQSPTGPSYHGPRAEMDFYWAF